MCVLAMLVYIFTDMRKSSVGVGCFWDVQKLNKLMKGILTCTLTPLGNTAGT